MAQLPNVFKPSEAKSMTIPKCWVIASVVKSQVKDTNAKDGKYLSLSFKVQSGRYKGRMLFTNLNLVNKNETTVQIAEAHLKKMCEAVGIEEMEDSVDLHGKPMGVKVDIEDATSNWPEKNVLKDFKDAEDVEVDEDDEEGESDDNPFSGFGQNEETEEAS